MSSLMLSEKNYKNNTCTQLHNSTLYGTQHFTQLLECMCIVQYVFKLCCVAQIILINNADV